MAAPTTSPRAPSTDLPSFESWRLSTLLGATRVLVVVGLPALITTVAQFGPIYPRSLALVTAVYLSTVFVALRGTSHIPVAFAAAVANPAAFAIVVVVVVGHGPTLPVLLVAIVIIATLSYRLPGLLISLGVTLALEIVALREGVIPPLPQFDFSRVAFLARIGLGYLSYAAVAGYVAHLFVSRSRRYRAALSEHLEWRRKDELELERAVAELGAKNDELGRFAHSTSHELKTPLVTIGGFLGILKRDHGGGGTVRYRETLERINAAIHTMRRFSEGLVALLQAGRPVGKRLATEMTAIVRRAVERHRQLLEERDAEVVVAADLPVVWADPERIEDVVANLIANAVEFHDPGTRPRIEIGARNGGEGIVFYVSDAGPGIPVEHHERVFDLFERLDAASESSGLGLPLSRRIVEQHGGRIWVESANDGEGTTVCFTVPDGKPAAVPERRSSGPKPSPGEVPSGELPSGEIPSGEVSDPSESSVVESSRRVILLRVARIMVIFAFPVLAVNLMQVTSSFPVAVLLVTAVYLSTALVLLRGLSSLTGAFVVAVANPAAFALAATAAVGSPPLVPVLLITIVVLATMTYGLRGLAIALVATVAVQCLAVRLTGAALEGPLFDFSEAGNVLRLGVGYLSYAAVAAYIVHLFVSRAEGQSIALGRELEWRREHGQDLERVIAELDARNADLERFSYSAAHELSGPLVALERFVGELRQGLERGDRPRVAQTLQRIDEKIARLKALLDELTQMARTDVVARGSI